MENTVNKFAVKGRTKLVSGSILMPELAGLRLIFVPCSETGKPDTALHAVLDKKWRKVGQELKGWFSEHRDFKLGSINTVCVQSDTWVINALCYDKTGKLDQKALEACVKKVAAMAVAEKASVHVWAPLLETMPSLRDMVGPLLLDKGVHCYFYDDGTAVATKEAEAAETKAEVVFLSAKLTKVSDKKSAKAKVKPKSKPAVKQAPVIVEAAEAQDTDDIEVK